MKLNKITTANASFLTQDICLQSKTTADSATCPAATTDSPDPTWPMSEAHFFMQVVTVANNKTDTWDKNKFAGQWSVLGGCATATALKECDNFMGTLGNVASAAAEQSKFFVAQGK